MAQRVYTVQVNIAAAGGRVVSQQINQVGQQARQAASALTFFRRTIAGLGLGLGIKQLVEYADSVTNLRNRLGLVTSSSVEVGRITRELFGIAKDTRSAFDETAQVYTRLALSAKQLGESNDELLRITRSLNQAVILSGANGREAANGLIQLSQAIASNRLGGDELRSVLEQLPLVADIIGEELGRLAGTVAKTRGEVRQLGFEGKITARVIIDAFKAARERLEKDFKNTVPTITQAFTVLTTSVIELIDNFNRFSNSSTVLAQAILLLANHMQTLVNVALVVGGAFAGIKLAALFAGVSQVVKGFFAARAALALFAAGAGPAVVGVTSLAGAAKALFLALGGLPALIGAVAAGLALLANANLNFFGGQDRGNKDAAKEAADALKDIAKIAPESHAEVRAIAEEIERVNGLLKEQADSWIRNDEAVEGLQKNQEALVSRLIELRRGKATEDLGKEGKERADLLSKILRQLDAEFAALQLNRRERERAVELARIEEQLRGKGFKEDEIANLRVLISDRLKRNQAEAEYREILDGILAPQEALTIATEAYGRAVAENSPLVEQFARNVLQKQIAVLEQSTRAIDGIRKAQKEQFLEFSDDASAAAQAYRNITDPALAYAQTMRVLNEILKENPELQREVTRAAIDARIAFLETQTTAQAGLERGFLKIKQEVSDTASLTEDALVGAFTDAKEALIDLFQTGKFELDDFINNLQRRLLDLAISGLFDQALSGVFKFLDGPSAGSTTGGGGNPAVFAGDQTNFANGGSFMVGGTGGVDSQQVAFRASPGERVTVETPEQQRNRMARGGVVNITVVTPDAQSFQRSQAHILARGQRQLDRASRRDG